MTVSRESRTTHRIEKFVFIPALLLILLTIPQCPKSVVNPPEGPNLTPPTNLAIDVFPGTRKVQVSWTLQTTEAVGVSVERRIGFFGPFKQMLLSTVPITSIIDSLTNLDSAYFYRVRHYKDIQFGAYSDTASINIGLPAPSGLDTVSIDDQAVHLAWHDNSTSEKNFTVERRDTNSSSQFAVIAKLDSNTTSYADTSQLDGGAMYYYRVKAFGVSDFGVVVASIPSNSLLVELPEFPAPTGLTVTVPAETSLVIHWNDNTSSESQFVIEVKSGATFATFDNVGANVTTYNGTKTLKTDSTYTFRIQAKSNHRRSQYSAQASGGLPFPTPSLLTATPVAERGISFTWKDNSTFESGFLLERRDTPSGSFVPVSAVIPADATAFMDSVSRKVDLTTYAYRISAITSKGNQSGTSNIVPVQFAFAGPAGVTMSSISLTALDLAWQIHSTSEEGLKIELSNLTLGEKDSTILPAATTHYSIAGLDNRYEYELRVKAFRGSEESRYSSPLLVGASASDISMTHSLSDTAEILAVAADSTGSLIASGGASGVVRLWSAATGTEVAALVPDTLSPVRTIGISPKNDLIAAGYLDGTVRVWNLASHALYWKKNTQSGIFSLAWHPTAASFATAHADHSIRIWDPSNGAVKRTMTGHESAVTSVAYSASGTVIASGSSDLSVKLWNATSGLELKSIPSAHSGRINSVSFLQAADSVVVSAGDDELVKVWDMTTSTNVATLAGHLGGTTAIVSPDIRTIVSVGVDEAVRFWKGNSWALARTETGHTDVITSAALSADRKVLVTGGKDKKIYVWSFASAWVTL